MPIPKPEKNESKKDFLTRCMGNNSMNKEYENPAQRYAICNNQTKGYILQQVCNQIEANWNCQEENEDLCEEELTMGNLIIPKNEDYIDFGEPTEEYDISVLAQYKYSDPVTNEIFYFDRTNTYKKNGRNLVYLGKAAEYQGRKVTLNKPFRTPDAKKKFAVYVKKPDGKVVIVRFGSQEMSIKRDDPKRRKSFRARYGCDNPGPKYKAKFWSCFQWRANSPVQD